MSNISIVRKEPKRKVVAIKYYGHLAMRGVNDNKAFYLGSSVSSTKNLAGEFDRPWDYFVDKLGTDSEVEPIYEGDLVEIQF